jgi:hypothetical protein
LKQNQPASFNVSAAQVRLKSLGYDELPGDLHVGPPLTAFLDRKPL